MARIIRLKSKEQMDHNTKMLAILVRKYIPKENQKKVLIKITEEQKAHD